MVDSGSYATKRIGKNRSFPKIETFFYRLVMLLKMKIHQYPFIIAIIRFFAFVISLLFAIYGGAIFFTSPTFFLVFFASITVIYAVGAITLLVKTHPKFLKTEQIKTLQKANIILSTLLPLSWFIGCLDTGIVSGQEIMSVLIVAICSAYVWWGVRINIKNKIKFA
ncbi:MAG: hypothetical protein WBB19_16755 [Desulforhopalus sp.]